MKLANPLLPPGPMADGHRVRRRLWAAGSALLLVTTCLAALEVARAVNHPDGRLALGHDLVPSYTAGLLVREGRADLLYDADGFADAAGRVMARANLDGNPRLSPWVNPPFTAWLFVPLSALPYRAAAAVWLTVCLLLSAGAAALLCRMLPQGPGWRAWALVPLLLLASTPFWQTLSHLQNTFLSLAILCAAVVLWRGGHEFSAGLVGGLLLFKPQVGLIAVAVLAFTSGRRAIAGGAVTGILLLVNVWTLPGSLEAWSARVPSIAHNLQTVHPYNWGRQVTFQGFWRLLLQGHVRGETAVAAKVLAAASSLAVAAGLSAAAWRALRGSMTRDTRDRLIGAAVAATPLLVPYYMDYDLLLLAVPTVLFAGEQMRRGWDGEAPPAVDRWLTRAWVVFFVAATIGPAVASATRFHPAVPALAAVSGLSIARCLRGRSKAATIEPAADESAHEPAGEPAARAA